MDLTAFIFLALIGILIGFLLGALVFNARARPGTGRTPPSSSSPVEKDAVRLWRDRRSQRLVVEIDGRTCQSVEELGSLHRRRLAQLAGDLRSWLGLFPDQPAVGQTPSAAASTLPPSGEGEAINLNPLKVFDLALQDPGKAAPEASIAAQIDAILQRKLEGTSLAGRGIRLIELPGQGLVVMVGLSKYTDLEQVPDADVRAVIGQAVAEWENQPPVKNL